MLKPGGYLAYVVPPSMNNGAYFDRLRSYIIKNTNIEKIDVINNQALFDGANQNVMILVLKKRQLIFQSQKIYQWRRQ